MWRAKSKGISLTNTFPIFVLTLVGDDERRAPLVKQLQDIGLPYELVFGIDGRDGLPTEAETLIDRERTIYHMGRPMTDGEFACALSHRSIYKRILDEGLPGAIVLEDDAVLKDGFAAFVLERDYLKAPMILIDCAYPRAMRFRSRRVASGTLYRCANQPTMTTAYCVSAPVAEKLLAATTPVRVTADWPTSLYHLGAWIMTPRLATHEPPNPKRMSHLDAERSKLQSETAFDRPRIAGTSGLSAKLRRRLSRRVGRDRGAR